MRKIIFYVIDRCRGTIERTLNWWNWHKDYTLKFNILKFFFEVTK
jgi:hypothetical protein